nr:uncharacterized protein LOC127316309 [Lolium perenne]
MRSVPATSLPARQPWPRPHTAAKKHPRRNARGHHRAVTNTATPPIEPVTLSASKISPLNGSKASQRPSRTREGSDAALPGPPDLGPLGPDLARAASATRGPPRRLAVSRPSSALDKARGARIGAQSAPIRPRHQRAPSAVALRCRPWPRTTPATVSARDRRRHASPPPPDRALEAPRSTAAARARLAQTPSRAESERTMREMRTVSDETHFFVQGLLPNHGERCLFEQRPDASSKATAFLSRTRCVRSNTSTSRAASLASDVHRIV